MPVWLKVLFVVLLAGCVGLGAYIVDNAVTGPEQASLSKPDYVERLIPESGADALAQSSVGVDLKEGYDAFLVINGTTIDNSATEEDEDGLTKAPTLGRIEYQPGPGRRVERLGAPGSPEQCVDAWVYRIEDGPETATQISWCFTVV